MAESSQSVSRHLPVLHAHGDEELVSMRGDGGRVVGESEIGGAEIALSATLPLDVPIRLGCHQILLGKSDIGTVGSTLDVPICLGCHQILLGISDIGTVGSTIDVPIRLDCHQILSGDK